MLQRDVELIRQLYPQATDVQFRRFIHLVEKTGLDPVAGQISLILRYNKRTGGYDASTQVSIDGYRLIADRTGKYAGNDDPVYDGQLSQFEVLAMNDGKMGHPLTATTTVYKMVDGTRVAFSATAAWDSYAPQDSQAFMWKRFPFLMLGKCAESLALRKAFPAELSGIYTDEEMGQSESAEIEDEPEEENLLEALQEEHAAVAKAQESAQPVKGQYRDRKRKPAPPKEEPPMPPADEAQSEEASSHTPDRVLDQFEAWRWILEGANKEKETVPMARVIFGLLKTGLYAHEKHVKNYLNGKECADLRKRGMKADGRAIISLAGAEEVYSRAVLRKLESEEEE